MDETRKHGIVHILDKILCKTVWGMCVLAACSALFMALMISVCVVLRYFFHKSVGWSTEVSEYLIYINVMMATPYVLLIDKHVRVDVFSRLLPKKINRYLIIVLSILGAIACAMVFYFGLSNTLRYIASQVEFVRVMKMKKWVITMFIPIMSFFSFWIFIRKIILFIYNKEWMSDEDYADFERAKMNPKYDTSASTDLVLPEDKEDEEEEVN